MKWAYGVTTVPSRRGDLLPRTLDGLRDGGFPSPRLFVDGADGDEMRRYDREFGGDTTAHWPAVGCVGNWFTALWLLYCREPGAGRYAIFQDDVLVVPGLRDYLERTPYPDRGYLNLYTCPANEKGLRGKAGGFHPAPHRGQGALALVFDWAATWALLTSPVLIGRPSNRNRPKSSVDGAIVTALAECGIGEYCHVPSLAQHLGDVSTMGHPRYVPSATFPGERFGTGVGNQWTGGEK